MEIAVSQDLRLQSWDELLSTCASNPQDNESWTEMIHRYGPRINAVILRSLYRSAINVKGGKPSLQVSDLFQEVFVRLIKQDCLLMKRFRGSSEKEWLIYLFVITQSVIANAMRSELRRTRRIAKCWNQTAFVGRCWEEVERRILMRELLAALVRHAYYCYKPDYLRRDLLVFKLHFIDGLSLSEIRHCLPEVISKTGIEKLRMRLVDHLRNILLDDERKTYPVRSSTH